MSFGLPLDDDEKRLTYGGYLRIRDLISLQQLKSDPPQHDETLFIIIHQVYELWFKQLIHELDVVVERLENNRPLEAHRLLRRCIEIEKVLVGQVAVLETMTPMDFLSFRDNLMPASGFQSAQFREMEFLGGVGAQSFLNDYEPGSDERRRLEKRLTKPSVGDAFYGMLRRRGVQVPDDPRGAAASLEPAERRDRLRGLIEIYQDAESHYDLFLLAESLLELDEMFALWRLRHLKMVERMIGSKTGTGGSEGADYLRKTVDRKFFPDLWELRTYLSRRIGGYSDSNPKQE